MLKELINLLILCGLINNALGFDCGEVCFGPHSAASVEDITCELLEQALACYEENREACDANESIHFISFKLNSIRNDLRDNDCPSDDATVTMASPTPPDSSECPKVEDQATDLEHIEQAEFATNAGVPTECKATGNDLTIAHCSIFMHSHLRPIKFLGRNDGIQTCSLPGAWYLFRHRDLIVEVEGLADQPPSEHTQLTKVNVTFPSAGECNPKTRSYIAHRDVPLSAFFTEDSGHAVHLNLGSPLRLHISDGGTVVTIRAPWLNASIVIRQQTGFLAVSLSVRGHMAFESEGLCVAGCPVHQYIDSLGFHNQVPLYCQQEKITALLGCFQVTDLLDVSNVSYAEACVYTSLQYPHAHIRQMTAGVAMDAGLLASRGNIPRPVVVQQAQQIIPPAIAPPIISEETTPTPEETTPTPEEATPTPEETTPTPEETAPTPEETAPTPKETTPTPEETTPTE